MKVAVLYGKGPTFGDHPAGDVRPDLQIAINQAGWFVPGVDAVVCCDRAPAAEMAAWCMAKDILLISPFDLGVPRQVNFTQVPRNQGWEHLTRRECWGTKRFYTEGFSSTVAAWYAWLCGCTHIITYGIGGDGYHPLFDGSPGNRKQGGIASGILRKLCSTKGMGLEIR